MARLRLTWIMLAASTLFAFALAGTPKANAQDASSYITCGLQAGVNLDFSLNQQCLDANSTDTSSQSMQPVSREPSRSYVALGDSVAAGLGLSGSAQNVPCSRSTQGYPNIVAHRLGLALTSFACSGATAGDLVTQQHINGPNPGPQLSGAFMNGTPRLITITAGANDAHWADFIRSCYVSNCATSGNTLAADTFLALLNAKLSFALSTIPARSSGSSPQVILTGYYNPLSAACSQKQSQVTPAELTWIRNETIKLNHTISTVASNFSFARFVPVSFAGHDLCSSSPWVQGLSDSAPLHPTAQGQRAIANDILSAIQ